MSVLQAVVLGAVQGLTEFIPISSSGHLVVVPELLGWDEPGLTFDVLLHSASLVALLVYFARELIDIGGGVVAGRPGPRRIVLLLAVGTVPAAIAGLAFGDFFAEAFENARAAALQLLITAAILVAGEQMLRRHRQRMVGDTRATADLNVVDAGVIGVAQAVAIFPGISRSGATISAGLSLGIGRDDAARFSFLLAIPALVGASLVEIPNLGDEGIAAGAAAAGFAASLVSSYAAIAGLIRYLRTRNLYPFAAYCVVAGIVFYVLL